MHFILYFDQGDDGRKPAPGRPNINYYVLLKHFRPVLARLGTISVVCSPTTEVDAIFEHYRALGESCVFVCFAPLNKVPLGLRCPTVPAFGWAHAVMPASDSRAGRWRTVLATCGRAIVLSGCAARAVRALMGPNYPVVVIQPPVIVGPDIERPATQVPPPTVELSVDAIVMDSQAMGLSVDLLAPILRPQKETRLQEIAIRIRDLISGAARWTCQYGPLRRRNSRQRSQWSTHETQLKIGGVVYTTELDPTDNAKNWSDLITAFRWAFCDIPDATLVLNIVNTEIDSYRHNLNLILTRLEPFQCRIVVIHGRLDERSYQQLVSVTSFYVNTSQCEAFCPPLMEFMACGKPALAPNHTAMEDFVDFTSAFVLPSSVQLTALPDDPQQTRHVESYRLDWESLLGAYLESYRVAKAERMGYAAMSCAARDRIRQIASPDAVAAHLRAFFALPEVSDDARIISAEEAAM